MQLESMQPLIDQGRKVWLWPDKDGIDKWQEVADKLGYDKVQVYTKFFDTCWIPEDGDKADAADITIRIMGDPTFRPREIEAEAAVANSSLFTLHSSLSDQEWFEHLEIMKAIGDYEVAHPDLADAPFLDAEELADPRIHLWRETLRQRYNFRNKETTNLDEFNDNE